jgi:hypothetical protein
VPTVRWLACSLLGVTACAGPAEVKLTSRLAFDATSCEQTRALTVRNPGSTERELVAIRRLAGAPVRATPFLDEAAPGFELVPMSTLAPWEETAIPVIFRPRAPGPHETTLEFDFGGQRLTVTLSAMALVTPQLPSRLDFGAAPIGDTVERPFEVPDGFQVLVPSGPFRASADRQQLIFTPRDLRDVSAVATVRSSCSVQTTLLVGTGVRALVTATPEILEFGPTLLGTERAGSVTLGNLSPSPLAVSDPQRQGPSPAPFRVGPLDGGLLLVPAARRNADGGWEAGEASLPVFFAPTQEGPATASFELTTPLERQPRLPLVVTGLGGGPDIEVSPTSLEFPPVTTVDRARLTVRNVGTVSNDPRLQLQLGADGHPPVFELTRRSGTGSVTVDFASPSTAGAPLASGQSVEVEVTAGPGPSVHHLRIFSNDPDEPEVTLVITVR